MLKKYLLYCLSLVTDILIVPTVRVNTVVRLDFILLLMRLLQIGTDQTSLLNIDKTELIFIYFFEEPYRNCYRHFCSSNDVRIFLFVPIYRVRLW